MMFVGSLQDFSKLMKRFSKNDLIVGMFAVSCSNLILVLNLALSAIRRHLFWNTCIFFNFWLRTVSHYRARVCDNRSDIGSVVIFVFLFTLLCFFNRQYKIETALPAFLSWVSICFVWVSRNCNPDISLSLSIPRWCCQF